MLQDDQLATLSCHKLEFYLLPIAVVISCQTTGEHLCFYSFSFLIIFADVCVCARALLPVGHAMLSRHSGN